LPQQIVGAFGTWQACQGTAATALTLKAAAAEFGRNAKAPVTWLVAANDTYFAPAFSRELADAFRGAGGRVNFHVLAASGSEGHWLPETESGVKLAAPELERALKLTLPPQKKQ